MSTRAVTRNFNAILFACLLVFIPLHVLAASTKGTNAGGASQTLETNVREALREHEHVEIEVVGEDVILRGYVHTRNEKNIVESQIREVPGVQYVRDEIKIGQSTLDTLEDSIEDTAITAAVKARILSTKGLDSFDIHVKTEQGVVTLSGKVDTSAAIRLAENVARATRGVKKVVNTLSL